MTPNTHIHFRQIVTLKQCHYSSFCLDQIFRFQLNSITSLHELRLRSNNFSYCARAKLIQVQSVLRQSTSRFRRFSNKADRKPRVRGCSLLKQMEDSNCIDDVLNRPNQSSIQHESEPQIQRRILTSYNICDSTTLASN